MTANDDFDRISRAWLDLMPDEAPDRAVQAVLQAVQTTPQGKLKVSVICSWHGVTPPTCYPHLDVTNGQYELEEGYTGDVADDVS